MLLKLRLIISTTKLLLLFSTTMFYFIYYFYYNFYHQKLLLFFFYSTVNITTLFCVYILCCIEKTQKYLSLWIYEKISINQSKKNYKFVVEQINSCQTFSTTCNIYGSGRRHAQGEHEKETTGFGAGQYRCCFRFIGYR